jgi:hypothetical protein
MQIGIIAQEIVSGCPSPKEKSAQGFAILAKSRR